jgi:hypothetical protein
LGRPLFKRNEGDASIQPEQDPEAWFSAMLRFVVLIEGDGAVRLMGSVYVFRARWLPDAHERALDIGRRQEEAYTNGFGKDVHIRLRSVVTLDVLSADVTDEREVYSEPADLPEGESFPSTQF